MVPSPRFLLILVTTLSIAAAWPAQLEIPIHRRSFDQTPFNANSLSLSPFSLTERGKMGAIGNVGDIVYTVDITICGQRVTVQLDTGSSDLWVLPPSPLRGVGRTNWKTSMEYGIGSVTGSISTCPVSLGQYSIPKQAFVEAESSEELKNRLFKRNIYGMIGLGFDSLSIVDQEVMKGDNRAAWGKSVLTNLFSMYPSTPRFVSFLLNRTSDPDTESEGSFTIGETKSEYVSVNNQPALPVFPEQDVRRWTVVLDGFKINGSSFPLNSTVPNAPFRKSIALLDTGASIILGPKAPVDAIFSKIPGSCFYAKKNHWVVPCLTAVNVTFVFADVPYYIHPLDLSHPVRMTHGGKPATVCTASIREDTFAAKGEYDWALGDTFQRNVYSKYDFGKPAASIGGIASHPFIKLLPLPSSHPSISFARFQTARRNALNMMPPTVDPIVLKTCNPPSN